MHILHIFKMRCVAWIAVLTTSAIAEEKPVIETREAPPALSRSAWAGSFASLPRQVQPCLSGVTNLRPELGCVYAASERWEDAVRAADRAEKQSLTALSQVQQDRMPARWNAYDQRQPGP